MLTWYCCFSSIYLCSNIIKIQVDFQILNHISKFEMHDLNILFCLYVSPFISFFPQTAVIQDFCYEGGKM